MLENYRECRGTSAIAWLSSRGSRPPRRCGDRASGSSCSPRALHALASGDVRRQLLNDQTQGSFDALHPNGALAPLPEQRHQVDALLFRVMKHQPAPASSRDKVVTLAQHRLERTHPRVSRAP